MKPTIGRIVLYRDNGVVVPAIVVRVRDEKYIDIRTLGKESEFIDHVEEGGPDTVPPTWWWPPRA
jgi:hypothetical protein